MEVGDVVPLVPAPVSGLIPGKGVIVAGGAATAGTGEVRAADSFGPL